MKDENPAVAKSYAFSKRVVLLYKLLLKNQQPRPTANQILRCGTSIGANGEEAAGGFSQHDFAAKCSIAHKEARGSVLVAATVLYGMSRTQPCCLND